MLEKAEDLLLLRASVEIKVACFLISGKVFGVLGSQEHWLPCGDGVASIIGARLASTLSGLNGTRPIALNPAIIFTAIIAYW